MTTIPQKQLRNDVSEVLRRVESGETFTVTVAGRAVAELGPARRRRWVSSLPLLTYDLADFEIIKDLVAVREP